MADVWACGLIVWEMIALSTPHVNDIETDNDESLDESLSEMQIANDADASMDDSISFLKDKVYSRYGK